MPHMAGRPRTNHDDAAHGRALAAQLRELRRERSWSRARLATASGVSERTLTRLETEGTADPGFFVVAALAAALGESLDDLASRMRRCL